MFNGSKNEFMFSFINYSIVLIKYAKITHEKIEDINKE